MLSRPPASYVPGRSPIHRCPAGWKVVVLTAYLLGSSLLVNSAGWAVTTCAVALSCYIIARIPWRLALLNLALPLPVLLVFTVVMWWTTSLSHALTTAATVYSAVAQALLLTLTTRVSNMMDALDRALRPFARWGLPVDYIILALALTMRLIPVQLTTINEVLDARKARGGGPSIMAFGVPVVVRTLLRANALGEALMSRGADDPGGPDTV